MHFSQKCGQLRLLPLQFHGCLPLKRSAPADNGEVITPLFKTTGPMHKPCSHANLSCSEWWTLLSQCQEDFPSHPVGPIAVKVAAPEPHRKHRGCLQQAVVAGGIPQPSLCPTRSLLWPGSPDGTNIFKITHPMPRNAPPAQHNLTKPEKECNTLWHKTNIYDLRMKPLTSVGSGIYSSPLENCWIFILVPKVQRPMMSKSTSDKGDSIVLLLFQIIPWKAHAQAQL